MKNRELMEVLSKLPADADVMISNLKDDELTNIMQVCYDSYDNGDGRSGYSLIELKIPAEDDIDCLGNLDDKTAVWFNEEDEFEFYDYVYDIAYTVRNGEIISKAEANWDYDKLEPYWRR